MGSHISRECEVSRERRSRDKRGVDSPKEAGAAFSSPKAAAGVGSQKDADVFGSPKAVHSPELGCDKYEVGKGPKEKAMGFKKRGVVSTLPAILRPDLGSMENWESSKIHDPDRLVHRLKIVAVGGGPHQILDVERQSTKISVTRLTESEKKSIKKLAEKVLAENRVGHKIFTTFVRAYCGVHSWAHYPEWYLSQTERFQWGKDWAQKVCSQNISVRVSFGVTRRIRRPAGSSCTLKRKVVALEEFGKEPIYPFEIMAEAQEFYFQRGYQAYYGS